MNVGQRVDIKLGNSLSLPYSLWKVRLKFLTLFLVALLQLMETHDTRTGRVHTASPRSPSILQFLQSESGYVPPVNVPSDNSTAWRYLRNPAGHQRFVFYARAPGRQSLLFSFVKPWLPDEQFDRSDTIITVIVNEDTTTG
eukprot:Protomagalhaensia_wolfi_Nauph_80__2638@NODE_2780_length_989_cov_28_002105_g2181_i0_p1_GENE_NODE_2780_length_989_cov_28_002105_g2181_i0NODE_2780_length_989_cov_28_002105_g2181_i0_p1_ORF_typecomplete_len141_score17_23Inhibitor_I42/PF09394_10/0_0043_NODE_2780_length_989_cov_28_002105_g2181_i0289711